MLVSKFFLHILKYKTFTLQENKYASTECQIAAFSGPFYLKLTINMQGNMIEMKY